MYEILVLRTGYMISYQLISGVFFRIKLDQRRLMVCLVYLICCSSCASVYVSSVRNTPLFTKKGEFQSSASIGNGANLNVAYAPANHIGIMIGGMYANNRPQNFNNTYRRHQSAEVAIGYFGSNKRISYETYIGCGGGRGYAQDSVFGLFFFPNVQQSTEGSYEKFFAQPTFAFCPKRFFLAVTFRVSYIEFKNALVMTDNANPQRMNLSAFVFEPSFTSKFFVTKKPTSMFVFAQVGFNVANSTDDIEYNMPFFMPHYNLGVGIRLLKEDP